MCKKQKTGAKAFSEFLNSFIFRATLGGYYVGIAINDASFYNYIFTQNGNSDFLYNQFRELCKTNQLVSGEKGVYYYIPDEQLLNQVTPSINNGVKFTLCNHNRVSHIGTRYVELLFRLLKIKSPIAYYLFIYIINHYFVIETTTKTENFFTSKGATIDDAIAFIKMSLKKDKDIVNPNIDSAQLADVTENQIKYALKLLKEKRLISDIPTKATDKRNSPSDVYIVCYDADSLSSQSVAHIYASHRQLAINGIMIGHIDSDEKWSSRTALMNKSPSELKKNFIKTILSLHSIPITDTYCAIFDEILHSADEAHKLEIDQFKIKYKDISQNCSCKPSNVYKVAQELQRAGNNLLLKQNGGFILNKKLLSIDITTYTRISVNLLDFSIDSIIQTKEDMPLDAFLEFTYSEVFDNLHISANPITPDKALLPDDSPIVAELLLDDILEPLDI